MSAPTTSAGLTGLLGALLAFQAEAPTLPKDGRNPAFGGSKYTKLDTIVERVQPLLAKHGLTWSTFPSVNPNDGTPALRYVLGHAETGATMEGAMPLLAQKKDPQGQGSAITYARRYAMCAVLNLVADEDDDGNQGSAPAAPPETTVAKDADRPAAPPIPLDRAASIADAAVRAGLASQGADGAYIFAPVLKAQLQLLGVTKIGQLNVDQAETVEAFIAAEAEGQS